VVSIVVYGVLVSFCYPKVAAAGDPYQVIISTAPSPYWGYVYNPYYSALHGAAALVRAQGDFLIKREQAALVREQVRRAKLVTRHAELQAWEWERDFRVNSFNRDRERVRQAEVERNIHFPDVTEIVRAGPLNSLLDQLKLQPALLSMGSTTVESVWLEHVHVTVDGRGNVGLLKTDKLFWPQLLLLPQFAEDRRKINELFATAKEQALAPSTYAERLHEVLLDLSRRVADLQTRIAAGLKKGGDDPAWNPRHFVEAMKFLKDMADAIVILEKPDAGYYLKPLQGSNVAELVTHMKKQGIRFAAATNGDEQYYVALHRALADEVRRLKNR
jgi:hypothetical protein